MREELGITPKELNLTLIDTAYSLIENGFVKKAKKYKQSKGCCGDQSAAPGKFFSDLLTLYN